jgi:hypothetical protein
VVAWWGWLIIWTGLVLGLIGMLTLSAWLLFRKLMRLFEDLGELAAKTELLDVELVPHRSSPRAVLVGRAQVRAREDARRRRRARLSRERHERRLARARRITRVDYHELTALPIFEGREG